MEPEREIEKTLREYAKQRREEGGAAPELHPATRKLLQGEVSRRRHRKRGGMTLGEFLWGTWPRLGFTLSSVAALVLGVMVVASAMRQSPELSMARNEVGTSAAPAKQELALAQPASRQSDIDTRLKEQPMVNQPMPAVITTADTSKADTGARAKSTIAMPNAPTTETPKPESIASLSGAAATAGSGASMQAVIPVATPPAAMPTMAFAATASAEAGLADRSTVVTQYFAKATVPMPTRERDDAGGAAVLASFRVELDGEAVRVIDGDGSVYSGAIVRGGGGGGGAGFSMAAATPPALAKDAGANRALPAETRAQSADGIYSFRVTGTNASIKQEVVFTGSFVANDAVSVPGQVAAGSGGGGGGRRGGGAAGARGGRPGGTAGAMATNAMTNVAEEKAAAGSEVAKRLNLRLRGQAVIGTNRVEIDAVPK